MKKRGEFDLGSLLPIAIAFAIGIVALGIGASVVDNMHPSNAVDNTSAVHNATLAGQDALQEVGGYLPTIGLVVAATIIVGLLISAFKNPGA
jgi:hypothetical protein